MENFTRFKTSIYTNNEVVDSNKFKTIFAIYTVVTLCVYFRLFNPNFMFPETVWPHSLFTFICLVQSLCFQNFYLIYFSSYNYNIV